MLLVLLPLQGTRPVDIKFYPDVGINLLDELYLVELPLFLIAK